MINNVYFTKMEQESGIEIEIVGPPTILGMGNREWEIDSHGGGGNQSPIPQSFYFAPIDIQIFLKYPSFK